MSKIFKKLEKKGGRTGADWGGGNTGVKGQQPGGGGAIGGVNSGGVSNL